MSSRPLPRIALHLLLALSLVGTGVAAPMQSIAGQARTAASTAEAMAAQAMPGMPCGDMPADGMPADGMPDDGAGMAGAVDDSAPCDCCTPHTCDLSACLGTACLPEFTRMAATVPSAAAPGPWLQPRLPVGVIDTPLRPPIA